jgi:hypothetical protein
MEYMGARAAASRRDLGLLAEKAREESWRDVIVFAAGHATERDRDDLLGRLLKPPLLVRWAGRWPVEAQVTTVCCLETVRRNLKPELLQQLHDLARTLFPPTDFARARLLVPAAAANPELLEGHQSCSEAQIAACIRTAAILGGERMLSLIESYAKVDGEAIDAEIARAWLAFDEAAFEQRVIVERNSFFSNRLTECSPEEAECLKVLLLLKRPRDSAEKVTEELQHFITDHSLNVDRLYGFSRAPIKDEDDPPPQIAPTREAMRLRSADWRIGPAIVKRMAKLRSLRSLALGKIEPSVIPVLEELTALQSVRLELEEAADLGPIARLPKLANVGLRGNGIVTLGAFRAAATLIRLNVYFASNYETLDFIGEDSALQDIVMDYVPVTDLQPISAARHLLSVAFSGLEVQDFAPLTSLPELCKLKIAFPKEDARFPYTQLSELRSVWLQGVKPSYYVGLADHPGIEEPTISEKHLDIVLSDLLPRQVTDLTLFLSPEQEIDLRGLIVTPKLESLTLRRATLRNSKVLEELPALRWASFGGCRGDFSAVVPILEARGVSVTVS